MLFREKLSAFKLRSVLKAKSKHQLARFLETHYLYLIDNHN